MTKFFYPFIPKKGSVLAVGLLSVLFSVGALAQVPVIDSVKPIKGIPLVDTVSIFGRNFNTTAANNIVYFGATKGLVARATSDSLKVTVPIGAMFSPVSVIDTSTKKSAYQLSTFTPVFDRGCYSDSINFTGRVNFNTSYAGSNVVRVGDIDGDGKPDVVTANRPLSTGTVSSIDIFRNTSTPGSISSSSFASPYSISTSTGFRPGDIRLDDIDGDGRLDIIMSGSNNRFVTVYRNTSTGSGSLSFASGTSFLAITSSSNPYTGYGLTSLNELQVGDFDRDGKIDIAVTCPGTDSVSILRNTVGALSATAAFPTTTFATYKAFSTGGNGPISISVFDYDKDGRVDIALSNLVSNTVTLLRDTSSIIGSIGFSTPVSISLPSPSFLTFSYQLANADIDRDGKEDFFVTGLDYSASAGKLYLFRNNSTSGSFSFSRIDLSGSLNDPRTLGVGDLNGDGKLDVVVANNGANNISVFKNRFSGSVSSSSLVQNAVYAHDSTPLGVVIEDLDGDTKPEIIVSNRTGSIFTIYRNAPITTRGDTIYGRDTVCLTSTGDTMTSVHSGGMWITSNPGIASIDPVTGRVIPVNIGTVTISYLYMCGTDTVISTKSIRVLSLPTVASISGPTLLCAGRVDNLSNATPGGVWGSLYTPAATIDSTTGAITGVAAGAATITYTVRNFCGSATATYRVTVNNGPAPITGTTFSVCTSRTITLSSATSSGTWSITPSSVALISSSGVVTGSGAGTAIATYTISSTTCYDTAIIRVLTTPAAISGSSSVCLGSSTTLTDATSFGSWSSSTPSVASIDNSSGNVYSRSAGSTTITFTDAGNGCYVTFPFTVNSNPARTSGLLQICEGTSTTLTNSTGGGSWSSSSTAVASISSSTASTAIVNAGTSGTSDIIFQVTATGCSDTVTLTVNPNPSAITGVTQLCQGDTGSVYNATSGGAWSTSAASIASINSATGFIRALSPGTATITYRLTATSCFSTFTFTTNPNPAAITGIRSICPGYFFTAASTTTGGRWLAGNSSIAVVDSTSGLVRASSGGTDTLTYIIRSTGCKVRAPYTIYPAPSPIIGDTAICARATMVLTDTTFGGRWSSGDTSIARIDSISGLVSARSAGLAIISYTAGSNGCSAFLTLTVNPILVPSVFVGAAPGSTVCAGTPVTYTAITVNPGTSPTYRWFVNRVLVGTGSTLTYTPVNGDTIMVRLYSTALCAQPDSATGVLRMTVNPLLVPTVNFSTGMGDTVCVGSPITFTPSNVNGGSSPFYKWYVNNVFVWNGPTWTYYPTDGDTVVVRMATSVTCRTDDTVSAGHKITVSPYVTPTLSISGTDTACGGVPTVYRAIANYAGSRPSYAWQVNGFPFTTGPVLSYYASPRDVISLTLTSSWPCLTRTTATATRGPLTLIPSAVPNVRVFVSPGWIVRPGTTVQFTAVATDTGARPLYRWFKNGIPISGATNAIYRTNVIATNDSFVCRVTNRDQCSGITSFGYIIMRVGDNVSIAELETGSIFGLSPNPNRGMFTLAGTVVSDDDLKIDIVNTLGQVIFTSVVKPVNGTVNEPVELGHGIAAGMYYLNIRSSEGSKTLRFVVE